MEQVKFSRWLKCIIVGIGICGLIIYALVIPTFGKTIAEQSPEFAYCYWPWLCFIWATSIPCYAVLVFAWRIATNIGLDRSFSDSNAKLLKWISMLAIGDSAFFFAGNILMLLLNMSHPSIVLLSFIVVFIGVAVAIAAAALSYLVKKAAVLQEQSNWTI